MSPTIRIDDEVWVWLQKRARPLEDTPNSVLRRVAGIDPIATGALPRSGSRAAPNSRARQAKTREGKMIPTVGRPITGDRLNRKHKLGLRQCLYHKDGTWYHVLREFPSGLCDPNGYVRYDDEHQFRADAHLEIGKHVNIRGGLSGHPRYHSF